MVLAEQAGGHVLEGIVAPVRARGDGGEQQLDAVHRVAELLAEAAVEARARAATAAAREWPRPLALVSVPEPARAAHLERMAAVAKRCGGEPLWTLGAGQAVGG